jgi:N-acetylneuraminic acid mutarotase
MTTARGSMALVTQRDGRVLAAGGVADQTSNSTTGLSSTELYDPSKGTWSPSAPMDSTRFDHSTTLLMNGQVLIAGGRVRKSNTETITTTLYIE